MRSDELPPAEEVCDRLDRHLRRWLGAWPPTEEVTVVGSELRDLACWDGAMRPLAGVETPQGTILSVPPRRVDAVRAAGSTLEEVAHPHVLVTGTPFVDVWQAVKPGVLGFGAWPDVPRGLDWKTGVCARLGVDPVAMWPRVRAAVRSYADLEPALVGAVERLIDFVAEPA